MDARGATEFQLPAEPHRPLASGYSNPLPQFGIWRSAPQRQSTIGPLAPRRASGQSDLDEPGGIWDSPPLFYLRTTFLDRRLRRASVARRFAGVKGRQPRTCGSQLM